MQHRKQSFRISILSKNFNRRVRGQQNMYYQHHNNNRRVRGQQHLYIEKRSAYLDLNESRFRNRDLEKWTDITIRKGKGTESAAQRMIVWRKNHESAAAYRVCGPSAALRGGEEQSSVV